MVSRGQRIRHVSDRILAQAGIAPQIVFTSRNFETLRRLCAEGMGYTFIPRHYIGLLGGGEYCTACYSIPDRYHAFWELSVVTLKDAYLSRAAKAFLKTFKESI